MITLNKRGEKKISDGAFKLTAGKVYEAVFGLTGYVRVLDDEGNPKMIGPAYYNYYKGSR